MELVLSSKTRQRIFNRKMEREKIYFCKLLKWENKNEAMITNVERVNNSFGFYTLRINKHNLMGEFNSPIYNVRASKAIRDMDRFLRLFKDPQERQNAMDNARMQEMRNEMKDKWYAMLNRHNFFPQIG